MTRRQIAPIWLPLVLTAAVFAAANGIGYGGGNLQQYLLHGLHAADPGFLAHDWFTVETRPHHVLFTAFIATIAQVVRPDIVLGVLNVFAASIFVFCVHAMARRLHRRPLLITATTLIIILGCPRTLIALVSMITGYFQPSTVGALGLLGGMILLARRRWSEAALTLALAGVFHIGYAIWVELLIATLLVRHRHSLGVRRSLVFAGVAVLVALFHAPFFLAGHQPDQLVWTEQAGRILHDVYMPYHSRPRTWPAFQWISAASILAAGAVAVISLRRPRRITDIEKTLAGFVAVISVLGILFTLVFEWNVMALLLPYRVLLLAILAAQVAAAAALISAPDRNQSWPPKIAIQALIFVLLRRSGVSEHAGITLAFATGALIVGRVARDMRLKSTSACWIGLLVCTLVWAAGAGRNMMAAFAILTATVFAFYRLSPSILTSLRASPWKVTRIGAAAILFVQLTWMARAAADRKDFLCESYPKEQLELFDWCRNHTPRDAVFAIPPDLGGFRLGAQRATVIDYKCMPILPADTVQWAARLADLCGKPIGSIYDARGGYRTMDTQRADMLRERYGVSYVILEAPPYQFPPAHFPAAVFRNQSFSVHKLSGRGVEEGTLAQSQSHAKLTDPAGPH